LLKSINPAPVKNTPRTLEDNKLMDIWTFGWTLSLIGMVGTMLVLWCLSLLILLLKKIFPYKLEATAAKKA
jgi:hypothetical protein